MLADGFVVVTMKPLLADGASKSQTTTQRLRKAALTL